MADIRRDIGQAGPILNPGISTSSAGAGDIGAAASMLSSLGRGLVPSGGDGGLSASKLFDIAQERRKDRFLGQAFLDSAATLGINDPTVLEGAREMAKLQQAQSQGAISASTAELRMQALAKQTIARFSGDPEQTGQYVRAMQELGVQPIKSILQAREDAETEQRNIAEARRKEMISYASSHELLVLDSSGNIDDSRTGIAVAQYQNKQVTATLQAQEAKLALESAKTDESLREIYQGRIDRAVGHGIVNLNVQFNEQRAAIMQDVSLDPTGKEQALASLNMLHRQEAQKFIVTAQGSTGQASPAFVQGTMAAIDDQYKVAMDSLTKLGTAAGRRVEDQQNKRTERLLKEVPELANAAAIAKQVPAPVADMLLQQTGFYNPESQPMLDLKKFIETGDVEGYQQAVAAGIDANDTSPEKASATYKALSQELNLLSQLRSEELTPATVALAANNMDALIYRMSTLDAEREQLVYENLAKMAQMLPVLRQKAIESGDANTRLMIEQGIPTRLLRLMNSVNKVPREQFSFDGSPKVGIAYDDTLGQFREAPFGPPEGFNITGLRAGLSNFDTPIQGGTNPLLPIGFDGQDGGTSSLGLGIGSTQGNPLAELQARRVGDIFGGNVMQADTESRKLNIRKQQLTDFYTKAGYQNPEQMALQTLGVMDAGSGMQGAFPTVSSLREGKLDPTVDPRFEVVKIGNNVYLRTKKGSEQSTVEALRPIFTSIGEGVQSASRKVFGE